MPERISRESLEEITRKVMNKARFNLAGVEEKAFQEAILNLPEDQRIVLHLRYSKDLSVREISKMLGLSSTTIYSNINKAIFYLNNKFNPGVYNKMYEILYPETGKPS